MKSEDRNPLEKSEILLSRRPAVIATCVLGLGMALSFTAFRSLQRAEQTRLQESFARHAQGQFAALQDNLLRFEDGLNGLVALFELDLPVTRDGFAHAAGKLLARFPEVQHVEWAPLVKDHDRAGLESKVKSEGFPDFTFRDRVIGDPTRLESARPAGEYLPVIYVEPLEASRAALGFNIFSGLTPDWMARARTTGLPSMSAKVPLLTMHGSPGFAVAMPVFRSPAPASGQTAGFKGAVIALFRADALLHAAKSLPASMQWFDLRVVDRTDPQAPVSLGWLTSGGQINFEPPADPDQPDLTKPIILQLPVWGRIWEFAYRPHPGPPGTRPTRQPLGVMAAGLLASVALALLVYSRASRTARIERAVLDRTAELRAAQALVLQSAEERTRMFERIDDAFIALDLDWRCVYANTKAGAMLGQSPAELRGRPVWRELLETTAGKLRAACEKALDQRRPQVFDDHRESDGKWLEVRVYPANDGVSIYLHDVTHRKAAERALRESETRYRSVVEAAFDAIFIADQQGRYQEVNPAAVKMFGYSREELIGLQSRDLVAPEEQDRVPEETARFAPGRVARSEWRLRRKDGSSFIGEISVTILPDGRRLGFVRDITERKVAEAKVQRLNRVYSLQSAINATIVRVENPQELLDSACRIAVDIGRLQAAWIGRENETDRAVRLLASAGLKSDPDSGSPFLPVGGSLESDALRRSLAGDRPAVFNHLEHEGSSSPWREAAAHKGLRSAAVFPLKVGEVRLGGWVLFSVDPDFFDQDEMNLLTELAANLSFACTFLAEQEQRQSAEAARLESETRFASAFEHAAIGMALVAPDGRFLRVNAALCALTGYEPDEMTRLNFQAITHPEDLARDLDQVARVVAGEIVSYQMEKRYIHKTGRLVWISLGVSLVRNNEGEPLHFISQIRDITESRRIRRELQENLERLRLTVQAANVGLWHWNFRDNTVHYSTEWKRQLGYRDDELADEYAEWEKRMHPADLAPMLARVARCRARTDEIYETEFRLRHRDGSWRWIYARGEVFHDDSTGEAVEMLGCHLDITARKLAEESLQRNERMLATIHDTVADAIFQLAVEGVDDYRFVSVNTAGLRLTGLTWGMIVGKTIREIIPADERDRILEKYREVIATKRMLKWEESTRYPAGTVISEVSVTPMFDDTGRCTHLVGSMHDITERQLTMEILRRREQEQRELNRLLETERLRLNEAQAVGKIGSWEIELPGRKVIWSEETYRIFETESASLSPTHEKFLAFVDPADRARLDSAFVASLSSKTQNQIEHRLVLPDGRRKTVEERWRVYHDEQGSPVRVMGTCQDITERRLAEEELLAYQRQFEVLFRNSPIAIAYGSIRDGKILDVNHKFEDLFGWNREQSVGRKIDELSLSAEPEAWREFRPLVTGLGRLQSRETRLSRRFGEEFEGLVSFERMIFRREVVLVVMVIDVTERNQVRRELRSRVRQQSGLAALSRQALASDSLQTILEAATAMLARTMELEYCKVLKLMPGGRDLMLVAGVGWHAGLVGQALIGAGQDSQAGFTLQSEKPVVVEDLRCETRFNGPQLLHDHQIISGASVIIGDRQKPWGVLGVHSGRPRNFSEEDINFLRATADLLGTTIGRAKAEQELSKLSIALIHAEDDERHRIARELHDSTVQDLVAAMMNLEFLRAPERSQNPTEARQIEDSLALLENCAHEIRTLSYLLHAPRLSEAGLVEAIRRYVTGFGERTGLITHLDLPADAPRLADVMELVLFRVVQESLSNINRHARSKTATVRMRQEEAELVLEISDQGRGLPPHLLKTGGSGAGTGVGLPGMRERLRQIGGRLEINSDPGGTTVRAVLPRPITPS